MKSLSCWLKVSYDCMILICAECTLPLPRPPCQTAANVNIVSQPVARQQLNAFSPSHDGYLKEEPLEQEVKSSLIAEPECDMVLGKG